MEGNHMKLNSGSCLKGHDLGTFQNLQVPDTNFISHTPELEECLSEQPWGTHGAYCKLPSVVNAART